MVLKFRGAGDGDTITKKYVDVSIWFGHRGHRYDDGKDGVLHYRLLISC